MERTWMNIETLQAALGVTRAQVNKLKKGELLKGHRIHTQGEMYAFDPPELIEDDAIDFTFVDLPTKKVKIDGGEHALARLSVEQLQRVAKDLFVGSSSDRFMLMSRIKECGPGGECRFCDAPRAHIVKGTENASICAHCLRDRQIDYIAPYEGPLFERDGVQYPIDPWTMTEGVTLTGFGVSNTEELLQLIAPCKSSLDAIRRLRETGIGPVPSVRVLDWAKKHGWAPQIPAELEPDLRSDPAAKFFADKAPGGTVKPYDTYEEMLIDQGYLTLPLDEKVTSSDLDVFGLATEDEHEAGLKGQYNSTKEIEAAQDEPFSELGDDYSDVSGNPVERALTEEQTATAKKLGMIQEDVIHPNGRCACSGDGVCDICKKWEDEVDTYDAIVEQWEKDGSGDIALLDAIVETHEKAASATLVFDGYCHAVSTADKDEDGSWEAARILGVGSSDSPIILGASRFMTVEELFNVKRGHPVDDKPWLDVYRHFGTWFEVYVRDEIRRQWYPDLVDGRSIGILVSDVYPWMCANIDAFSPSEKKLTEVKTRSKPVLTHADRIQVHHQMAVTGLESAEVVIVIPPMDRKLLMSMREALSCSPDELAAWILSESEVVRHDVPLDEDLLASIVNASCTFWDSVQAGQTPEQQKSEELEATGSLAEAFVLFDLGHIDREEFLQAVESAITSPYIVRVRCDGHLVSRTQKGAWIIKMKTEEVEI